MTTSITSRIQILIKAVLHIISLIVIFIIGNVLPSYLAYRIIYPHHSASNFSGGLLLATTFITLIWLVDKLSRVTSEYKTLLNKKNQSKSLD